MTDSLYDRVGGQAWFDALVERFYEEVADDPVLRPMYPDDLEPGKRHLALFLGQYWGGPGTYSEERGHPRLRARHLPFSIGIRERDEWVACMAQAMHECGWPEPLRARLHESFANTADWMRNRAG